MSADTLAGRPRPFQVIPDLPTFVGRQTYLETLPALLRADHHNGIYVLEGTADMGKTVLAARLAYWLRPYLPDGVLWARLDTTNPLTILRQFAGAYGNDVSRYEDLHSCSQVAREILTHKRALMVLDNVPNNRQIEPLLPPSGACAVLITTRYGNLSLAHGGRRFPVELFAEAESLALFGRALGTERVTKERATYIEIANMLGHLPLAIDIVACRLAYEPGWAADMAHIPVTSAEANLRMLFCLALVRRGRAGRYRLIPLLRAFAREKIDELDFAGC